VSFSSSSISVLIIGRSSYVLQASNTSIVNRSQNNNKMDNRQFEEDKIFVVLECKFIAWFERR
jgi:hypothetical protein